MAVRPADCRPGGSAVRSSRTAGVDTAQLSDAFTTALAPKPADRFPSCAAFVAAIRESARASPSRRRRRLPFDAEEPAGDAVLSRSAGSDVAGGATAPDSRASARRAARPSHPAGPIEPSRPERLLRDHLPSTCAGLDFLARSTVIRCVVGVRAKGFQFAPSRPSCWRGSRLASSAATCWRTRGAPRPRAPRSAKRLILRLRHLRRHEVADTPVRTRRAPRRRLTPRQRPRPLLLSPNRRVRLGPAAASLRQLPPMARPGCSCGRLPPGRWCRWTARCGGSRRSLFAIWSSARARSW